jgi:hypothetical protein
MAVGLGSIDMPVPSVTEWEWLNWKFPRAVRAGETIYARWTLTQKRAPVGGAPTAIVVWRVDVHTASGALCAEGEVGASVMRNASAGRPRAEEPATATTTPAPRRGRRRRRTQAGDGAQKVPEAKAAVVAEAPIVAPPAAQTGAERPPSGTRRRRRRRSPGSAQARNGDSPAPAPPAAEAASPPAPAAAGAKAKPEGANTLSRVIRRLRRP